MSAVKELRLCVEIVQGKEKTWRYPGRGAGEVGSLMASRCALRFLLVGVDSLKATHASSVWAEESRKGTKGGIG